MHLIVLAAALAYVELVTALPRRRASRGFPIRAR
jgi:hypothetical protein